MPMKVEAAIVTQKRAEASFNTDSVNVNGKVFPRDVIKNGYKGSGIISGSVYFALTSSVVDGFADAAVAAFNERAQVFNVAKDARTVFSGFYEDCRNALLNMGRKENELTCAGFFAKDRKVVLSGNEGVKLYLSRLGNCTPVTPEKAVDTTADYSSCVFADVTPGDIFILLSPGSAEVLSEKEIEDICRISDGSVKRIVSYITKVGLAKEGGNAVSAIVVKILETAAEEELRTPAFVPDFGAIEEKEEKSESATEGQVQTPVSDTPASEEAVTADAPEQKKEELSENIPETEAEAVTEAVAEEAEEKEEASEAAVEPVVSAVAESTDEATEEEVSEELSEEDKKAKAEKRTRKILFSILGVLVAISIALIGVIIAYSGIFSGEETTTAADETTTVEETTEEETTDEETTGEEATEESTSEEAATEAEATTNKPQNTVVPVTPAVTTTEQSVETTAPAVETTEEEEITSEEAPSEPVESTTENTESETDPPAEEEPATEAAPSEEAPSEETPAENTEENTAAE
ncbi:MAG: hypothetical protein E7535_05370 [Ruminococcaceae bacterium]|nr:hypothetical protein [Oscillospiraceae bacterium]